MSLPFDFHPAVRGEVNGSYRFYEKKRVGLGQSFLNQVERALSRIGDDPEQFSFAEDDIRQCLVKRFPFVIYYRLLTDRIRILSVFHASRDPDEWKSRS